MEKMNLLRNMKCNGDIFLLLLLLLLLLLPFFYFFFSFILYFFFFFFPSFSPSFPFSVRCLLLLLFFS
ncbi:hypothetical protein Lalb_Chr07g0181251 [Lupinus albus]|uniref:Uncharacterized protein n=1 Tax=Lupinus albus TaxID=3870 RepID=A0A6A4Q844_LUPAL|nr:hypothetical protein Lalb_Chr07g0181251 [Lupinus albus]